MQVTKNITLDLLETGSPVIIKAKQNDRNTRYISAHLYVDGLAYPVPNGTEIAFRYKKPDGTAGFYDALPDNSPAITVSGNTVTVELVEQVLTAAGCVHCEINMYNAASEKLTTFTFEISVEESVLTDAEIISSDYYNVLTAEIEKALQAVTDATEQAENAADSAAMSKDWAAGQPVTYNGTPVSIAYAGAQRIASITAYGENAQGGTTEAPVALTGVDSVFVGGNNLFSAKLVADKVVDVNRFTLYDRSNYYSTDTPIPVMKNTTYRLSSSGVLFSGNLHFKNKKGKTLSQIFNFYTFTVPNDADYIMFAVREERVTDPNAPIMLNVGTEPLPYEPYQGSVTQLPIQRPLRRVGDVRDVCRTRVKSVYDKRIVLDGTENWNISSSKPNSFLTPVSERIVNGLSDSYPTLKSPEIGTKNGIYLNYTADIIVTDLACSTVEEFKAHLSAHPLTVYYRSTAYDGTNGLDVCLTEYQTGYIESYADESITTAWISSMGALSTGAEVAYVLSSPETYATDPLDIDNAAGPLTVMTGGELEVRMTELIGSRSPELTAKMDKDIYFQVGNLNLGDNTNLLNPVNQQGQASYTGDSTSPYCIDRWRISNGTTYNIVSRTLTASSYANRACGMWQTNELAQQALAIGSTITFSGYINGMQHFGTMKIHNRDLYSSFAEVPAGYECDDFEIVCCTASHEQSKYNLGIYPKKEAVLNWIKWEKGLYATPYAPKGFGLEQLECMRYFQTIKGIKYVLRKALASEGFPYVIPVTFMPMRAVPQTDITVTEGAENNLTATGVTQTACGIQFQPVAENVGLTFTLTLSANL